MYQMRFGGVSVDTFAIGIRLDELVGFFADQNYQLYQYRTEEGARLLYQVHMQDVVEDNYVFIHPGRLSRFVSILATTTGSNLRPSNPPFLF